MSDTPKIPVLPQDLQDLSGLVIEPVLTIDPAATEKRDRCTDGQAEPVAAAEVRTNHDLRLQEDAVPRGDE